MPEPAYSRDDLAAMYLDSLPYEPYPVQEEALLAWFTAEQGIMVCAPTGTGKTLIAEAALFEALHNDSIAYYTTPLIALTEQKFQEIQEKAVAWGFEASDVGLVTGNRRVNPEARVLVVVAEILLNRLMHGEAFDFTDVSGVVMDEFHSFNDRERGIVWELSLGLLPPHVRTLLLSATVGNAYEFSSWLRRAHGRTVQLVQSDHRNVPLTFEWVEDKLLPELLIDMAEGEEANRRTPALVFCFNRDECWNVAELLKGKKLLASGQQAELVRELDEHDFSQGSGPKLRQILLRGVGVHHAGIMPKYRRLVEHLYQKKLLSVAVCTETLSAGINLPARSVVMPSLMKGPPDKKFVIEASSAHQIFGRAGRPQFDDQGFVYALAHEDDVKLLHWRAKYDQIPEDTKDPGLRKAKKALKKKMPKRRANVQYWTQQQYEKLQAAPPSKLESRGHLPWRLLAHMLEASPEIEPIRELVGKRLQTPKQIDAGQKELDRMLMILWRAGYVSLEPEPPMERPQCGGFSGHAMDELQEDGSDESAVNEDESTEGTSGAESSEDASEADGEESDASAASLTIADLNFGGAAVSPASKSKNDKASGSTSSKSNGKEAGKNTGDDDDESGEPKYRPLQAIPTELLPRLKVMRSVNPLYGVFLVHQLGIADRAEILLALESVLELPGTVARYVRVPRHEELPPGPLATERLDPTLLRLGLVTAEELREGDEEEEEKYRGRWEDRPYILTLAQKLRIQFDYDFPGVHDLRITPVWAAGRLMEFDGQFNQFITSYQLQKQEGIVFRHVLRLILLLGEIGQLCPPDLEPEDWQAELTEISEILTNSAREVDPTSTEKVLEQIQVTAELAEQGDAPV